MKLTQYILAGFTVATAAASPTHDGEFFSALLKRQQPGTPAYDCHNSCGQAIIQAREGGDDVCDDAGFVSNYDSCLECAGPDNFNIWQHYGSTLSAAGEACGFDTEPATGGSDDGDDGGDSDDDSSSDDSSPAATDDVSPSETSPSAAEPTGDDDASDDDDGDSPSESGDGSEEPTSGDDSESSSPPGSTDIPQTDDVDALKAGFVGIAVAAACAGGLLM